MDTNHDAVEFCGNQPAYGSFSDSGVAAVRCQIRASINTWNNVVVMDVFACSRGVEPEVYPVLRSKGFLVNKGND